MFSQRITKVEDVLRTIQPSGQAGLEHALEPKREHMRSSGEDRIQQPPLYVDGDERERENSPGNAYSSGPPSPEDETAEGRVGLIDTIAARHITHSMDDELEPVPGPYVPPGKSAIPANHTTPAGRLLNWPSVQVLVRKHLESAKIRFIDEFPIRREERRGLLRVWGRGEGLDSSRPDRDSHHDQGVMEVHDDYSDAGAPSPADCWGGISSAPSPSELKSPWLGAQSPDFSEANVRRYVQSYEENIQNMHPLIIPLELHAMVKMFLDGIQQGPNVAGSSRSSKQGSGTSIAKFVSTAPHAGDTPGSKRKRSPGVEGDGLSSSPTSRPSRLTFQRSITNALVLLVLALGKICLVKDKKIPDVVPVTEPVHGSPVVKGGYPQSPIQDSPSSTAGGMGPHSHSHSQS